MNINAHRKILHNPAVFEAASVPNQVYTLSKVFYVLNIINKN